MMSFLRYLHYSSAECPHEYDHAYEIAEEHLDALPDERPVLVVAFWVIGYFHSDRAEECEVNYSYNTKLRLPLPVKIEVLGGEPEGIDN